MYSYRTCECPFLGFLLEVSLTPEFNPQITDISLESFFFILLFSRSVVSDSSATPWTDPGVEPESPALADGFFTTETQGSPFSIY